MKNTYHIATLLLVIILSSCKQEIVTRIKAEKMYGTKNYFPFSPDDSFGWGDVSEPNTVTIVLENIAIVNDFDLKYITEPKGKNPTVGWHKEKETKNGKIVDVPITSIQLLGLGITKQSHIDGVSEDFPWPNPIEDYLSKIEVFIKSENSLDNGYYPARSVLLASCNIDSCKQEYLEEEEQFDYGTTYITGMNEEFDPILHLKPTYYNMANFIEIYSDYWIEIVATYDTIPEFTRFASYNAVIEVSGEHTGK
jgi:hypothetical protein